MARSLEVWGVCVQTLTPSLPSLGSNGRLKANGHRVVLLSLGPGRLHLLQGLGHGLLVHVRRGVQAPHEVVPGRDALFKHVGRRGLGVPAFAHVGEPREDRPAPVLLELHVGQVCQVPLAGLLHVVLGTEDGCREPGVGQGVLAAPDHVYSVADVVRLVAVELEVSFVDYGAPNCWEVSRLTMQSAQPSDLTGGLLESVIDSFADKSNSTLHSRAGPLVRYVQFWVERGVTCFPIVEVQLYTFVKSLEDPAPTFPNSLLTSLRFAHFVLGLVIVGSAVDSGRIKGAAAAHYARKRKDARRPALTRLQLRRLEDTVLDSNRRGHDRVAAGYFLFLVYGRLRYSDGQRITALHLDVDGLKDSNDGFLECVAERTKTQTGLAKKRKALPVVIPVQSAGRCWIFEWLEVRRQMGLVVSGQNITEPLLPAPATGGRWTRLPLPVSEAAAWLRSLLEGLVTTGDIRVGTHSCKATLLSWCAKKGLGHGPRKLLGYHVPRADRSLVIYSRDELASPLRSLVQLLRVLRSRLDSVWHAGSRSCWS